MPRPSPRVLSLLLVPVLLVSVSCSTGDSAFGPSSEPPAQRLSTVVGTATSTVLATVDLLTCSQQPYVKSTKVVGPEGGTITFVLLNLIPPTAPGLPTRLYHTV